MRLRYSLLVGAGAVLGAQLGAADVIMSNLAAADDAGGTLFGPGSTTVFKAYGFTMPNQAYFLDEVQLRVSAYDTDESRVSIWDGAGTPQNELAVLDNPTGPGVAGYFTLDWTPASSFTLEANQTYWVYVEALNGGGNGFLWGDTTPSTDPSGVGTSVGFVFNGNPSSFRNVVAINGTIVPEPAAVVLLGIAGLLLRRR